MKIVIVSDTHGGHEGLGKLHGDVLIHCGDIGAEGQRTGCEIDRLDAWFMQQSFRLILCTGGNHDFGLEQASQLGRPLFANATYLQDKGLVFEGIKFYGAPWLPELSGWAFYQERIELRKRWASVPHDTHVLMTHTPPYGILDRNSSGRNCGCRDLRERIGQLRLRLHCFGHIHASAGVLTEEGTTYINASMVNRTGRIARAPFEMLLE